MVTMCPICKTFNQVHLMINLTEFTQKEFAWECRKRKWFCHRCKLGYDENGDVNTI